jgi:muramoyltetrapeptide carboxypeptidase
MLRESARIAVVAPAGVFSPDRLKYAIELLAAWGYEAVLAPNVKARRRYLAGTVDERAADLAWALTAPDIDAVWFARGGYGTAQILARVPWDRLDRRPVVGFSDATALLAPMANRGLSAVHGPVLHGVVDFDLGSDPPVTPIDTESRNVLRRLLVTGEAPALPGRPLCGPREPVQGRVVGGNLTVLASLCGTPWALDAAGAIVALEDIREAPYRIERALCQLIDSGAFKGAAGVALGDFYQCRPDAPDYTLADVLRDHLGPLGIPVVFGLPFGHSVHNYAWIHGAPGTLGPDGITWDEARRPRLGKAA